MPVSMEFLRGVLGLIGIACAYMLGRSLVAMRKGWQKPSRFYGWLIRTILCLGAIAIRHAVDLTDIILWVVAAAACELAIWNASREKPHEEPMPSILPDDK